MAVEECVDGWEEVGEQCDASTQLIDKKDGRCKGVEFARKLDLEDEMQLASYGAEDREAGEEVGGNENVTANADVKRAYGAVSSGFQQSIHYWRSFTNHRELRRSSALSRSGK